MKFSSLNRGEKQKQFHRFPFRECITIKTHHCLLFFPSTNADVAWRNLCNDHHVWDGKIQMKAHTSLCYKRNDWTAKKITRDSYMESQGNALTGLTNCDKDTLCSKFQKGDSCPAGKQQSEPSLFIDSFQLSIGIIRKWSNIHTIHLYSEMYSVLQWGTTGLSSLKVRNHF